MRVYFDFPFTETTGECCHFISQTLRVQGVSETQVNKTKMKFEKKENQKKKINRGKLALQLLWLKENSKSQKEGVNLCGNSIKQSLLLRLSLHRDSLQQTASLGEATASPTHSQFPRGHCLFNVGNNQYQVCQKNLVDWAGNYRELFLKCKWDSATFISFLP